MWIFDTLRFSINQRKSFVQNCEYFIKKIKELFKNKYGCKIKFFNLGDKIKLTIPNDL